MTSRPTIDAEVAFLSPEDGGRARLPDLSAGCYKPHLVIQSPKVRKAAYQGGHSVEDYLGVVFILGPVQYAAGQPILVTLSLGYYPEVDYGALEEGATFTVREGGKVVGFGKVIRDQTGVDT